MEDGIFSFVIIISVLLITAGLIIYKRYGNNPTNTLSEIIQLQKIQLRQSLIILVCLSVIIVLNIMIDKTALAVCLPYTTQFFIGFFAASMVIIWIGYAVKDYWAGCVISSVVALGLGWLMKHVGLTTEYADKYYLVYVVIGAVAGMLFWLWDKKNYKLIKR